MQTIHSDELQLVNQSHADELLKATSKVQNISPSHSKSTGELSEVR